MPLLGEPHVAYSLREKYRTPVLRNLRCSTWDAFRLFSRLTTSDKRSRFRCGGSQAFTEMSHYWAPTFLPYAEDAIEERRSQGSGKGPVESRLESGWAADGWLPSELWSCLLWPSRGALLLYPKPPLRATVYFPFADLLGCPSFLCLL